MANEIIFIGFALLFVAILLITIGAASSGKAKVAVGGFIGPIPFGFANDPRMLWLVIALTLAVFIIFLVFGRIF